MDENGLDKILEEIQDNSLNSGGYFQSYVITKDNNSDDCLTTLKKELQQIERYNNPSSDGQYFESRDLNSINLKEIDNWELELKKEIKHWTNFELIDKTTIERYNQEKIDIAENKLIKVLKSVENEFNLYINNGNFDTDFAIWGDHITKDLFFELKSRILIIHFGWSS